MRCDGDHLHADSQRRIRNMHSVAMKAPVFGGDALYAETEVLELGGDAGEVTAVRLRPRGRNQHGHCGAELDYVIEMWNGPHPGTHWARPGMPSHATSRGSPRTANATMVAGWNRPACSSRVSARERPLSMPHAAASCPKKQRATLSARWTSAPLFMTHCWPHRPTSDSWPFRVAFGAPVAAGDAVQARSTIAAVRASSSRPHEGIASVLTEAHNQRDEQVLSYRRSLLVYRRDAPNPYLAAGY